MSIRDDREHSRENTVKLGGFLAQASSCQLNFGRCGCFEGIESKMRLATVVYFIALTVPNILADRSSSASVWTRVKSNNNSQARIGHEYVDRSLEDGDEAPAGAPLGEEDFSPVASPNDFTAGEEFGGEGDPTESPLPPSDEPGGGNEVDTSEETQPTDAPVDNNGDGIETGEIGNEGESPLDSAPTVEEPSPAPVAFPSDEVPPSEPPTEGSEFAPETSEPVAPPTPFPEPTFPPTPPPTIEYVSTDDDPINDVEETDDQVSATGDGWQWNESTVDELEHDKTVVIALSVVFGTMFLFSVLVAHQMLHNPQGICASICRITVACLCGILRCFCYPCRALCGCTGSSRQPDHMIVPDDGHFTHDLELS